MAGETAKARAICLRISPWSRTSHIVDWLTEGGRVTTSVKGAVRPKSAFLGQYDLNYTCEIVYYVRARGEIHALRECSPVSMREGLRSSYRAAALAGYCRSAARELAPSGPEARGWYALLARTLDSLSAGRDDLLARMLAFEMDVLGISGISPALEAESGAFSLRGERKIPVSAPVAACLRNPLAEKNREILLDAARVIGVFYNFHLDCAVEARRSVLNVIL